jgi:phosphoribosylformimino-5-aminoimidazole carboxamide ribotide isomerase
MIIIPAIDLIGGEAVRLEQGAYDKKTKYFSNPIEAAKMFEDSGLKHLHLVDLDGAKQGEIKNLKVLENIAKSTQLKIDFSGGISSKTRAQDAFNAGANVVSIGSMAVKQPELFSELLSEFGGDKIWLGADVRNGKIATKGWTEQSEIEVVSYLKKQMGLKSAFVTDISKDGMLQGVSEELYAQIISEIPNLNLIASGGVASISDLQKCKELGLYGAIVGKAIYEGKISLTELKPFI